MSQDKRPYRRYVDRFCWAPFCMVNDGAGSIIEARHLTDHAKFCVVLTTQTILKAQGAGRPGRIFKGQS